MSSSAITFVLVQASAETVVKWARDALSYGIKQLEFEVEQFLLPTSTKPPTYI